MCDNAESSDLGANWRVRPGEIRVHFSCGDEQCVVPHECSSPLPLPRIPGKTGHMRGRSPTRPGLKIPGVSSASVCAGDSGILFPGDALPFSDIDARE